MEIGRWKKVRADNLVPLVMETPGSLGLSEILRMPYLKLSLPESDRVLRPGDTLLFLNSAMTI